MTRQIKVAPATLMLADGLTATVSRVETALRGQTNLDMLRRAQVLAAQASRDAKALQLSIRGEIAAAEAEARAYGVSRLGQPSNFDMEQTR